MDIALVSYVRLRSLVHGMYEDLFKVIHSQAAKVVATKSRASIAKLSYFAFLAFCILSFVGCLLTFSLFFSKLMLMFILDHLAFNWKVNGANLTQL